MNKLAVFFLIVIIIVVAMSYIYLNYSANYKETQRENKLFESYKNQEIYGIELTTIINKAVSNNQSNEVQKDNKGIYINNDNNSINIDLKMTDNDKTYSMETIYNGGMNKFKCTKIEYHASTGRVKYMLFEQITQ